MDRIAELAGAFVQARQTGTEAVLERLPEVKDFDEALRVQAAVTSQLGQDITGWKVWLRPDGPVSGPMYNHIMKPSGSTFKWSPQRFAAMEIEISFRLAKDLPERHNAPYTLSEIREAVGAVIVGMEIVQSRIARFRQAPFPMILADNIANGEFITGTEVADWRSRDLSALRCKVFRDDEMIHDAVGGHGNGDPINPLVAYANQQISKAGGLKAGQVVTTGSLCGLIPIEGSCEFRGVVEGLGEVALTVVA